MPSSQFSIKQKVHTAALTSIDRAVYNTGTLLMHKEVTNAHLALGILATGNNDQTLPIPRSLRDAGADYTKLYEFLEGNFELRSQTPGAEPRFSASAKRTLARASKIAKLRANNERQQAIITVDLLVAILRSNEPLLGRALKSMGVDSTALLTELTGNAPASRPQHLRPVN